MKVTLFCYREHRVIEEGQEEVEEVELSSFEQSYMYGKEKFITIKLDNKLGHVKMSELQSALKAFEQDTVGEYWKEDT